MTTDAGHDPRDGGHFEVSSVLPERLPGVVDELATSLRAAGLPAEARIIGTSRGGRPICGLVLGNGPLSATIVAGSHADEPGGPLGALRFLRHLAAGRIAPNTLAPFTIRIVPHINPDGAEANRTWLAETLDFATYCRHVVREPPGEDIEFGYPLPGPSAAGGEDTLWGAPALAPGGEPPRDLPPGGPTPPPLRPENLAAARFFGEGPPPLLHASLHGMGFAEGAWLLIGRHWIARSEPLRAAWLRLVEDAGLPLHDIDRRGEKGFTRIAAGFCTTPESTAMRAHFLAAGDTETAALFRPSSMEFAEARGADPLLLVTELPLFLSNGAATRPDPPGDETAYSRLRAQLAAAGGLGQPGAPDTADALVREFSICPVPFPVQASLIAALLDAALRLAGHRFHHPEA